MFKQKYILDITDLPNNSEVRRTLEEFAQHTEMSQHTYSSIDIYYIQEVLESEDEEFKAGWHELMSMMREANIFEFILHFWW